MTDDYYLAALENEEISNEQAKAVLMKVWEESDDPQDRAKPEAVIKKLVSIAATASGGLRGGAELVDGATSKNGVDYGRVGTVTVMGVVDVYGGAGATKLASFRNQVLERSLLHASPLVKNAAYLASFASIEGGSSGALSGGLYAGLEGKSVVEGTTHGFLWGTVIGGAIRGTHLAATRGVQTRQAIPDSPGASTKPPALESYPKGAWEAVQRIAKERKINVSDLGEAELHTIGQRELEIQGLMRASSLGYLEAREALNRAGLLLSGQNSFPRNKLKPRGGGRPESLHRVTSQVLSELPENFHSLPYVERVRLARDQIQKSFDISAETPFTFALGQTRGSLLTEISETIAGITPQPTATPRYRSIPIPKEGVSTLEGAKALWARDTRGGRGYIHTSTQEGALGFVSSSGGQKAVFVYPEGTDGFVINGRGRVFQDGKQLQGSLSPERAAGFVENDWGVLPRGLGVSRVEQIADGAVMIYLERKCPGITDFSALGGVHTLYLSYCQRIKDVSSFGGVHTLDLGYCRRITDVSSHWVSHIYLVYT